MDVCFHLRKFWKGKGSQFCQEVSYISDYTLFSFKDKKLINLKLGDLYAKLLADNFKSDKNIKPIYEDLNYYCDVFKSNANFFP